MLTSLPLSPGAVMAHAVLTFLVALAIMPLALKLLRTRTRFLVLVALCLPFLFLALALPLVCGRSLANRLWPLAPLEGLLISPAPILPLLGVLIRVPTDYLRTARGLGADWQHRLRFLWFPLLRGRLVAGLLMALLLSALTACELNLMIP